MMHGFIKSCKVTAMKGEPGFNSRKFVPVSLKLLCCKLQNVLNTDNTRLTLIGDQRRLHSGKNLLTVYTSNNQEGSTHSVPGTSWKPHHGLVAHSILKAECILFTYLFCLHYVSLYPQRCAWDFLIENSYTFCLNYSSGSDPVHLSGIFFIVPCLFYNFVISHQTLWVSYYLSFDRRILE